MGIDVGAGVEKNLSPYASCKDCDTPSFGKNEPAPIDKSSTGLVLIHPGYAISTFGHWTEYGFPFCLHLPVKQSINW